MPGDRVRIYRLNSVNVWASLHVFRPTREAGNRPFGKRFSVCGSCPCDFSISESSVYSMHLKTQLRKHHLR